MSRDDLTCAGVFVFLLAWLGQAVLAESWRRDPSCVGTGCKFVDIDLTLFTNSSSYAQVMAASAAWQGASQQCRDLGFKSAERLESTEEKPTSAATTGSAPHASGYRYRAKYQCFCKADEDCTVRK